MNKKQIFKMVVIFCMLSIVTACLNSTRRAESMALNNEWPDDDVKVECEPGDEDTRTRFAEEIVENADDCEPEEQTRFCTEFGSWSDWDGSFEYSSCFTDDGDSDQPSDFMDFFIIVQAALMY